LIGSAFAAGSKYPERLADELVDDLDSALFAGHKADTLTCHQRPGFDVAVNDRAPQRAMPSLRSSSIRVSR